MDQQQREGYPVAYPPVPKCIIKEEPEEATTGKDQDECSEHRKGMTAYYPLPHGAIKEESSSGEVNSGIQVSNYFIESSDRARSAYICVQFHDLIFEHFYHYFKPMQQEGSKTNDVPTTSTFAELPTQGLHLKSLFT